MRLSGRSFSLADRITAIRAERDPAQRRALLTRLALDTEADQAGFARFASSVGATSAERYWTLNACVVEIAPGQAERLRAHAQVIDVRPDEYRLAGTFSASIVPAVPGATRAYNGTDDLNHAVDAAQALIGTGTGAVIALLDSGVDLDQSGTNSAPDPDPHLAFRDSNGASRVLLNSLAVPYVVPPPGIAGIDCNLATALNGQPAVDPWCPPPIQTRYPSARHGTGVAGIILGVADTRTPGYWPAGHATDAKLLSFAVSLRGANTGSEWPSSTTAFLSGLQQLEDYVLALGAGQVHVHVVTTSYTGWPDPDDPVEVAFDRLERVYDILPIALLGNEADAAQFAHGFTNGLSVGNVHRLNSALGRYPHRRTSRGPLAGDPDRYVPDVCATGAGYAPSMDPAATQIVMPLIDHLYPGCNRSAPLGHYNYNAQGTSMSSPQVAGAAGLYRAYRTAATAKETRAAILLATIDPFLGATQYPPIPTDDHTYTGRNTVGIGYVRDDLLARFATGLSSGSNPDNALATTRNLTPQAPSVDVTYSNLVLNQLYKVVVAWPRETPDGATAYPWANVDLEVRSPGGVVLLARSDSLRNTYEHAVFRATSTSALLRVSGSAISSAGVPVQIVARAISNDATIQSRRSIPGYVMTIPQEPTCTMAGMDSTIQRVLPSTYRQAYGSRGVTNFTSPAMSNEEHRGFRLAESSRRQFAVAYGSSVTDGAPYTIRALTLRTWAPLPTCATTITIDSIHMATNSNGTGAPPLSHLAPSWATPVAASVVLTVPKATWTARQPGTWTLIVPLTTPFPVPPGQTLEVWFDVASLPPGCDTPQQTFEVDATEDGSSPYGSRDSAAPAPGVAPIIGIIEDAVLAASPRLDIYGFPVLGRRLLMQIRGTPANSNAAAWLGTANPNLLLDGCRILTNLDLGMAGSVITGAIGQGNIVYDVPNNGALLHQHIFAQVAVASGNTVRYSNGTRWTVGGFQP